MTREDAIWQLVHIYGTYAYCESCRTERSYPDYKQASPNTPETDIAFGQWLLSTGWTFHWNKVAAGFDAHFLCSTCSHKSISSFA